MKIKIRLSKLTNPFERKRKTGDFFSHNCLQLLQGKKPWLHFSVYFGIRRSDKLQWFPFWNVSDCKQKSAYIGFWKFYIQPTYCHG